MLGHYYVVNVEAAIFKDGRYLLVRRGPAETHAAGTLSLVGGKVEAKDGTMLFEGELRREVKEEVGIDLGKEMVYIESKAFLAEDGDPVVDVVFLCRYIGGKVRIVDPGEVSEIRWLTASEVQLHPDAPPWTRRSVEMAEHQRCMRGW